MYNALLCYSKYAINIWFMLSFKVQMGKIRTLLIDSQTEDCSQYVLKILANFSLNVLIKKVLKKFIITKNKHK